MISRRTFLGAGAAAAAAGLFGLASEAAAGATGARENVAIVSDAVVARMMTADGVIRSGTRTVSPYFGDLCAALMARCWTLLPESGQAAVASHLRWRASRVRDAWGDTSFGMRLDGITYDYWVVGGSPDVTSGTVGASKKKCDSTDSYPAVFVSLVRAYYDNAPDGKAWLADPRNRQLVIDEADNLLAQLLADGLSFSHPDGDLKYSADNCEVWRGLVDAAYLMAGDAVAVAKYTRAAGRIKAALLGSEPDGFMRGSPAYVAVAKKRSGRFIPAKIAETWYPDATFQLFPIYTGLIEPADPLARRLWTSVRDNWRNGSDRDFTLGTADGWKNGVRRIRKSPTPGP